MAGIKEKLSAEGIKTLLLKHGEKIILGLVAMFVLMSLVGTQWTSFKKVPGELTDKLSRADEIIEKKSPWPEEEKAKYPDFSPKDQVAEMLASMSSAPFSYGTPFWTPPGGQKEPFKEPVYLPVVDLIASPGRTMLAQQSDEESEMEEDSSEMDEDADDESMTDEDDDEIDDDFKKRKTTTTAGDGANSSITGDIPARGLGGLSFGGGIGAGGYEQEIAVDTDPNALLMGSYNDGEDDGMGMGMGGSSVKGVAVRYISVRGIFDLRKQIQNYARALQTDELSAEKMVKFIDFKLERQVADSPQGPWDGEWEPVDIAVANDYLTQALDHDQDPVSAEVRDTVITMPLPARLMGVWRNKVNHPSIKNFELSDEEMQAEAILNQKIMEEYFKKGEKIVQEIPPGGFAKQQLNMSQVQGDFLSNDRNAKQLSKSIEEEFADDSKLNTKQLIEKIKEQVSAAGNLALFRYIDFDVEPGKSYKYRVQLVLRNPNFNTPVDQVNTPSVVEGQLRETPPSEPSNVASVAEDYAYFLSQVRPPRGAASKIAEMLVYEWFDESGTMIKGKLPMELGDYIGGVKDVYVLRPDKMTYEKEDKVPFKSNDLLIDASLVERLDGKLHADLKRPQGLSRHETGIPSEALVLDHEGHLRSIDPISLASLQKKYERNYTREKESFEDIKDAKEKSLAPSDPDGLFSPDGEGSSEMMEEMMGPGMMGMGTGAERFRGRKGNASRLKAKGGRKGSKKRSR